MTAPLPSTLPPAPSPMVPCPLREGLHVWIWPGGRGEGWKTAREQAERALSVGAVGVIPQSSLIAVPWLQGRDPGEANTRVEIFAAYGLQVTAGMGMDGHSATRESIVRFCLDALDLPHVCLMGDEEKQSWETRDGRNLATLICDDVISVRPDAPSRSVFCPWWKPDVHSGAPDREFWRLFRHLFPQDYGAHGPNVAHDETLWMAAESRREYARRGIPADYVHLAFQMYAHSRDALTRILFSGERVMCGWDIEEADAICLAVLAAYAAIQKLGFATTFDGIAAFQITHSLPVTRALDNATLHALGVL